jgi:NitT/TauT family transport system substrate-binding protein
MVYRTGTGLAFDEAGYELNFIWLDDYGIHFYADTIVATEQLVQENPELVQRFLRATLEGWRYAIENQEEAVDMTLQYDAELGKDRQERMMQAQIPLIHTGDSEIGWMEDSVWQEMYQMLLDGGILDQPIDLSEAYTMQFLNSIYGVTE